MDADPISRGGRLVTLRTALDAAREGGAPVLADGSTGSVLETLAPELGARLPLAPLLKPSTVESLHRAYLEAGSRLVETATFQANGRSLAKLLESEDLSAAGLGGAVRAGEEGGQADDVHDVAYRVNLEAARIARRAADAAGDSSGLQRWVAGSMGPGDEPPSLGSVSWASLVDAYIPQARGLADGGADLAIIETAQDPLQVKAAIAALRDAEGGRGLPFIVSATVEPGGRLLAGTSIEALVAIVAPFGPLALGLNCSGGPFELGTSLAELAALSPFPLTFMPNAGIPRELDGRAVWPLAPGEFAAETARLARRHGIALAGGCCGTGPAHIAALARALDSAGAAGQAEAAGGPRRRAARKPALASLYEARPVGPGLFRIGERANAAGSAAFAALVDSGDFDGAAAKAVEQEGGKGRVPADALDIHAARRGRDEGEDLEAIVARLSTLARAALSLDSTDPAVLERVLPLVGGRPLINSTSLEDPGKARRVFELARLHGAAVVCLAIDKDGPARTAADKCRVCRALYDMATGESGLEPSALFFDPLTFTIAAGPAGAAGETLEAIALIKEACPGSFTVLGVGNVSYGLPKAVRPAVTASFLALARARGLDAAIMDCGLPEAEDVDPALRGAVEALVLGREREGEDPMAVVLARAESLKAAKAGPSGTAGGSPAPAGACNDSGNASSVSGNASAVEADPVSRLSAAVLRGDARAAVLATRAALGPASAAEQGQAAAASHAVPDGRQAGADSKALGEAISGAMAEAGRRWSAGELPLPLVLRSAEAARAALDIIRGSGNPGGKGSIVLATVRGDLHDIGKNIAGAIIACSGWQVVDLGMDVGTEAILAAVASSGARAVGLSGLLTRSLAEMRAVCEALAASAGGGGPGPVVLAGGAAVDPGFVARVLEPILPGRVKACADAFEGLAFLDEKLCDTHNAENIAGAAPRLSGGAGGPAAGTGAGPGRASAAAETATRPAAAQEATAAGQGAVPAGPAAAGGKGAAPIVAAQEPAFVPDALGASGVVEVGLDELLAALDRGTLFGPRWGYRREDRASAEAMLAGLADELRRGGLVRCRSVSGFFGCRREGEHGLAVAFPEGQRGPARREHVFEFPVERHAPRRCLAHYFRREGDVLGAFAVTIGPELASAAAALRAEGRTEDYWRLHGLGSALAEAAAEIVHRRLEARALSLMAGRDPPAGTEGLAETVAGEARARPTKRYSFGFPACPGVEAQAPLLELLGASRAGLGITPGFQLSPEHSVTAIVIARADAEYFSV